MSDIINRTVVNEYYPCGALLAEKRLKNGKLDGVSKYYKKDGRLWAKQFWINGIEHAIEYCLPQRPPKQIFM
jgi:antitoxin component YwqK of YwqJK toxin-antitoxin module